MIIIPDKLRRPAEAERDELKKQLAEARAEIERKDETIDACSIMLSARESLMNKQSKLIEQMREALQAVQRDDLNGLSLRDKDKVDAALSAANRFAAERGEGL